MFGFWENFIGNFFGGLLRDKSFCFGSWRWHGTCDMLINQSFKSQVVLCFPRPRGRFTNSYEILNLRVLNISMLYKNQIFQRMGKIFCVEFQRVPLKFHTKYLTHTMRDEDFIHSWKLKSQANTWHFHLKSLFYIMLLTYDISSVII